MADWAGAFGTILASFVALGIAVSAVAGDRRRERASLRRNSILGAAVLESLLEEVRLGLQIIEKTLARIEAKGASPAFMSRPLLPGDSWDGMHTISDAILLRIIATSENVPTSGFRLADVRSHCKNYFVHIRAHFNDTPYDAVIWTRFAPGEGNGDLVGSTKGAVAMLEQACDLLKHNAKQRCPL